MLVLDALFDHFQQISSNVEIIESLVPNKRCCGRMLCHNQALGLQGPCSPGCQKNFTPRFFAKGLFLRNFSAPSMRGKGEGWPRAVTRRRAGAAPALRPTDFGHLQNFQRLRAPLSARLRSPRATLAETARIRHLIEIKRASGRTSALSVRITCFPTA